MLIVPLMKSTDSHFAMYALLYKLLLQQHDSIIIALTVSGYVIINHNLSLATTSYVKPQKGSCVCLLLKGTEVQCSIAYIATCGLGK